MTPVLLVDLPCATGENPLWHPDEQRIYWTDIPNATLHRCAADGSELESFAMGAEVGGFTLQEDGALLLFMARGAVKVWRDGEFLRTVLEEVPGETDGRFNDVIADPEGRVFCGTMSTPNHAGRFYRLDPGGTLTLLVEGMGTPNGMGFSPDEQTFYQNDSRLATMYRWRYDRSTGGITHREIHLQVDPKGEAGRPDGMTVDAEGGLWTGRWGGGRVTRHTPDGTQTGEILFPGALNVTSLTLVGATAYVTTASLGDRTKTGPQAGCLYRVDNLTVRGKEEYRSKI